MSFILDALRKSERERQRNESPGIAVSQAQVGRRGSGFWLPLVALLIGVNLSLLLVMWIMTQPREGEAPANTATPATAPPAYNEPSYSEPSYNEPSFNDPSYSEPTYTRPADPPASPLIGTDDAVNTGVSNETVAGENVPTLDELLLANAITVPPMRIDIHVYSDKPEERFVFINMNRYNEGDTMSEGPLLLNINESGVVLRHQGQDFQVLRE